MAAKLDALCIEQATTATTVAWYDPYAIFAFIDLIATLAPDRRLVAAALAFARINELAPTAERLELLTFSRTNDP